MLSTGLLARLQTERQRKQWYEYMTPRRHRAGLGLNHSPVHQRGGSFVASAARNRPERLHPQFLALRQLLPFRGWRVVSHIEIFSRRREICVEGPQPESPHNGRRQEVNVDPAHAATMQAAIANEQDDVRVRDHARLMQPVTGALWRAYFLLQTG
jgi:hypothetical protein